MSFSDKLKSFETDPKSRLIIERWLGYGDPDDMWEKLLRAEVRHQKRNEEAHSLARLDAREFIQLVLSARYGVDRLIAHESMVRDRFARLKASFVELIKLAESPRDVDDAIAHFKLEFERLDRSIYDYGASTAVSRKDQNGSRTRKAFKLRVESYLAPRCGSVMNEITNELLDIVFDKEHSEDQGRIARRPTTKAGRGR
jgi:hypothetical protein